MKGGACRYLGPDEGGETAAFLRSKKLRDAIDHETQLTKHDVHQSGDIRAVTVIALPETHPGGQVQVA